MIARPIHIPKAHCPDCSEGFRTWDGLLFHFERYGHGRSGRW